MSARVSIRPLRPQDREAWDPLARGYKSFYETPASDEELEAAWQRLHGGDPMHGICAEQAGRLVGIAHYLFHANVWSPKVCYLQDLFTAPQARGAGVGRALIEAVADEARRRGATRYYWLTQERNAAARLLYDKIAQYKGFLRYDFPL